MVVFRMTDSVGAAKLTHSAQKIVLGIISIVEKKHALNRRWIFQDTCPTPKKMRNCIESLAKNVIVKRAVYQTYSFKDPLVVNKPRGRG